MSDKLKDIIKELLISDKIIIGFYQDIVDEWEINRIWDTGKFYGVEVFYFENNKKYSLTQFFDKYRIEAILRDYKLKELGI